MKNFIIGAIIIATLLFGLAFLLFTVSGCKNNHSRTTIINPPPPVLTQVITCTIRDDRMVLISAHTEGTSKIYRTDDLVNHIETFTGSITILDNPCPGTFVYVIEDLDTGAQLSCSVIITPVEFPVVVGLNGQENKVQICHNGHTIEIAEPAVDAHLNHGDYLGECQVEPPVPVEDCSNGIDDDGDGLVDCMDVDCQSATDCQATLPCNDPWIVQ